jgi:hypothetical protein
MLFRADTLDRISSGEVTLAFRRWRRPTVRVGGTLVTPVGVLSIDAVDIIDEGEITDDDAVAAGSDTAATLLADKGLARDGELYRVRFHLAGEDPRIALRSAHRLDGDELVAVLAKLARMDRSSRHGPWTAEVLWLIEQNEGVRAGDLAARVDREMLPFKSDVRKLKALGLTESLEVGYRLSPRGHAVLPALEQGRHGNEGPSGD